MKKALFLLFQTSLSLFVYGQWSGPTGGWLSTSNSVSISQLGGLTGLPGSSFNPLLSLSLTGYPTSGPGSVPGGTLFPLHVTYEGRVGIGTNTPSAGLHVMNTNILLSRANGSNVFNVSPIGSLTLTTDGNNNASRGFFIHNGTDNIFSVTPQYILFSDGTNDLFKINSSGFVYARKVVVTLSTPFPDFVFEKNYQLMPLNDLRLFIKQHKHLPGMPAAAEVEANNNQVEVGEMQAKLLQKVEELTLYVLKQQEEIDELKRKLVKQ